MSNFKIYHVDGCSDDALLLIDVKGRRVINGAYDVVFHKNGKLGNKVNDIKSTFVGDVPKSWESKIDDYNYILWRWQKEHKKS